MAKKFAMIFGWIFVVIGILGFVPNPIVGSGPNALFMSDTAHSLVHLISGAVILWVAYGAAQKSAMVLKVFGIVYLLIAIFGFISADGSVLRLIHVNSADNWLHVVLAALFLWAGFAKGGAAAPVSSTPMGGPQM